MSDLNKEALDVWGALKPMIDQEISSKTQGMVQRRKAKVTTAPSLVTNTIGVTEAFGQELFLPFVTNIASAKVGDLVWIEWMYGASNAFVSSFAEVDKKDFTVAGTFDVLSRRCYATLSSQGWYRAFAFDSGSAPDANDALGVFGTIIDIFIARRYGNGVNEVHKVTLLLRYNGVQFVDETSSSGLLAVTKIRWNYETNSTAKGYLDIYYDSNLANIVCVWCNVYPCYPTGQNWFSASGLSSVAASPSGETELTSYNFRANKTYGSFGTPVDVTTFPYTPTEDGLLWVLIRANTNGRTYANFSSLFIADGYQTSGGYINALFPVQKGTAIPSPTLSNVSSGQYKWYPLG